MAVELDRVIPLPQAAKQMGMTVEALTRLVASGKLRAMKTSSGEVVVPESETETTISREQFEHLLGKPISIRQAAQPGPRYSKKNEGGYAVPYTTLIGWVHKGLIEVLTSGYGMELDEADVAYCAAVYHARGKSSRIFDKAGRPYVLKNPQMAEYQRKRRHKNKTGPPSSKSA